jgi:hypothetical protein
MSRFLKWAELPARDDIYQDKGTTEWGNHDLYPITENERTYGKGAFMLYWLTCGGGLSTFAIGSSYIAVVSLFDCVMTGTGFGDICSQSFLGMPPVFDIPNPSLTLEVLSSINTNIKVGPECW